MVRLQKALTRRKVVESVWFSKDVKEDILRKSDGVCAHCGCPVAIGDNFTVEHVVPISKGGTNDLVNIVALCQTCNTTKGDCVWHPYEYLTYLHDENKKELGEYIDKYFHDKRWFTRNNFCQVDFKKIEVNIPFAGKQKTLRRGDQTLLARRCMTVNYKLQKALYYDLQDIYDMQIAYMKRNKLKVDKAAIKETISNAFLNGAIYYVARSDGTKVGSFAVRMEERCPELLPDFKAQHLDLQLPAQISEVTYVDSTDMYARSREIYKMQKIKTNILTVWYEHMLTPRLE